MGSDWVDQFQLRPYFSDPIFTHVVLDKDILEKYDIDGKKERKIFLVNSYYSIKTKHHSNFFGKIQVTIYRKFHGESIQRRIRDELIETVDQGKEVAPELAPIYKNIWEINNQLDIVEENFYYYNLWIKCFELREQQRSMPFKIQLLEVQSFLNKLKSARK